MLAPSLNGGVGHTAPSGSPLLHLSEQHGHALHCNYFINVVFNNWWCEWQPHNFSQGLDVVEDGSEDGQESVPACGCSERKPRPTVAISAFSTAAATRHCGY